MICLNGAFAQNVQHECLHAVRSSTLVLLQHYACIGCVEHLSSLPVLDIAQLMLQVTSTELGLAGTLGRTIRLSTA